MRSANEDAVGKPIVGSEKIFHRGKPQERTSQVSQVKNLGERERLFERINPSKLTARSMLFKRQPLDRAERHGRKEFSRESSDFR